MILFLGVPLIGNLFFSTFMFGAIIVLLCWTFTNRKLDKPVLATKALIETSSQIVPEERVVVAKEIKRIKPKKKSCGGKKGCCKTKKTCKTTKGSIDSVKIFYATQTGNAKAFAQSLSISAEKRDLKNDIVDLAKYDPEDNLSDEANDTSLCIFVVSTYTDGSPPESASWFFKWLEEASNDFRVQKTLLKGMKYAVFGLGNSLYGDNFNKVGKKMDGCLHLLQAVRVIALGMGDENPVTSLNGGLLEDFEVWQTSLWEKVAKWKGKAGCGCGGEGKGHKEEEDEGVAVESSCDSSGGDSHNEESDSDSGEDAGGQVLDLEELGSMMKHMKDGAKEDAGTDTGPKEMITPLLRESLTKQGYRLIGSHSGVKLCRWTKSMLRGRGGCYKHTFYGIESHRCMETTPSLACANKCVFCWRHHSNPVGTEWKWKMDDPEMIVNGALDNHYKMINQFKGVPGIMKERLDEGMKVKHCALSLVGEPIMYPEINTLVRLLHSKEISSFLVTNAQFPAEIRKMDPVTQLYVSVDASTKDSLKKIDRPLFKDFWERFIDSLKALSEKGQRTVYRLTLVKAWNAEEIENYAQLVALGNPDFIEIKGVTYCGTSKASSLTMENVPWHEEVVSFVQKLVDYLPNYEIASEHEHSNCVLIAHEKFKVEGKWHTWIDYAKFHELMQRYYASNGEQTFSAKDYMAPTPEWAVIGSSERGFDPVETRWHRKNRKDISGC
ncbi:S-adenosyl-L-methionine-dependent tRNA 4-demethylwyosine synthase TYW1-like [Ischnura elegans]|uniref:S-adenosyl-L-methionine-dependent tRNA 4-demethylwyosine synthase TYW1-like n=1 Tax=Ischnura elegans TaxID=197161 RepID=UPI001ED8B167|nr:S-adenosyl-L-methionine-dependent tRNA 4-demethylwyosine synthase TYW1-like [Ischnura elegans]